MVKISCIAAVCSWRLEQQTDGCCNEKAEFKSDGGWKVEGGTGHFDVREVCFCDCLTDFTGGGRGCRWRMGHGSSIGS